MTLTFATALLLVAPIALALFLGWASGRDGAKALAERWRGVVAPYFMVIGILFSLFAGFLANDIWVRGQDDAAALERSFEVEAGAIRTIRVIARSLDAFGAEVEEASRVYAEAILAAGRAPRDAAAEGAVELAMQGLVDAILAIEADGARVAIAQTEMLEAVARLVEARSERPRGLGVQNHDLKWTVVVILGLLTQAALALVHVGDPPATRVSVWLFTIAFVVVLAALAIFETSIVGALGPAESLRPLALPEGP